MPNLTNSEAIAFYEDHNRFMAKEVAADKRAEWIEQRVKDMMADGQEYYPFKPAHVTEALSELCFADEILLASYVSTSFSLPNNDSARINLADFVVDRVQDYWHKIAVFQAQEEYDKAGF